MKISIKKWSILRKEIHFAEKVAPIGAKVFIVDAFVENGNPFIAFETNTGVQEIGFSLKEPITTESDLGEFVLTVAWCGFVTEFGLVENLRNVYAHGELVDKSTWDTEPFFKKPIPKGLNRFFIKQGHFTTASLAEFSCYAMNKENALKKYRNYKKEQI